jgi:UDP-N-acetylmuramoyl-tripeptide--D-alanyl-D-alanine ligase
LCQLAKYSRKRLKGKLIGVTGSVGKTSSKEMLKLAFQHQGKVFANEGSFNNHIGLPLSLARMPQATDYAVIEMGMNHAGELNELSLLASPDIAIITTVEAVHLENFKSVSAIADAKSEIFDGMKEGGYAIINYDNPYHQILINKAHNKKLQVIGFSESQKTPARLISYELKDDVAHVKVDILGKNLEYTLKAKGKHLAFNSVAMLTAVKLCGAELDYAASNLAQFESVKGRGKTHSLEKITLIDESYNASPVAIRAALQNLSAYKNNGNRLVAILGAMVELGPNSPTLHAELAKDIIRCKVDKVFTVGDMMKHLFDSLPSELQGMHLDDSEQMAKEILNHVKEGDAILIKGSRKMKMERVVESLLEF